MRVLVILLVVAVSLAAVIKLPLTKKKVSIREKFSSNLASISEKATSFDWPMGDIMVGEFFGMIEIGSQNERMFLKLDIGFQSTWIPNSRCTKCHAKNLFNERASATYIASTQPINIPNGQDGNINGIYATDSFGTMGPETTVTNQCFISANEDGDVQQFSDGGMGISWLEKADTYPCPNYIWNLKNQNITDEAIIGLYLDDEHPSMHIGGINEEDINKDDVFYFPNVANVDDPNFVVSVESVGLQGGSSDDQKIAFQGPISVALTTGTTDIKLTQADFDQLTLDMPTKGLECELFKYRYACTGAGNLTHDDFPNIWLKMIGDSDAMYLKIQPSDYVNLISYGINETTHLAIFNFDVRGNDDPWGYGADWVLGTPFLANYYSLFNMNVNKSIGLGSIKESHKIYKSWDDVTDNGNGDDDDDDDDDSNTTTIVIIVVSIIGGLIVVGLIIWAVIRCKKRQENEETGGDYGLHSESQGIVVITLRHNYIKCITINKY